MATVTSAAVTIPTFSSLPKLRGTTTTTTTKLIVPIKASAASTPTPKLSTKAITHFKEVGVAIVATAASALLMTNSALAVEVKMGSDDGALAFIPNELTIAAGDTIEFLNNAGFPHNVRFDEDEVPAGVDAEKISMNEEDLLNAPGEKFAVTLKVPGTYSFYCAPHQGAGMVGKVTVN